MKYWAAWKRQCLDKVRDAAFRELNNVKAGHTKVMDNKYINLNKPQEYIISKEFTNTQCSLLFCDPKQCKVQEPT